MINFDIFWVFFKIGFLSFGGVFGVLPELERMIVVERGWITHDQFIHSYVISQFLPGPNMVMCPLIGYWVNGAPGMVAGFAGIYLGPLLVMGAAYAAFSRARQINWVKRIEISLRPLVFGLLLSAALKLTWLQTTGVSGDHLYIFRFAGIALTLLAMLVALKNKLSGLQTVFATGLLWWLTNWALYLQK